MSKLCPPTLYSILLILKIIKFLEKACEHTPGPPYNLLGQTHPALLQIFLYFIFQIILPVIEVYIKVQLLQSLLKLFT